VRAYLKKWSWFMPRLLAEHASRASSQKCSAKTLMFSTLTLALDSHPHRQNSFNGRSKNASPTKVTSQCAGELGLHHFRAREHIQGGDSSPPSQRVLQEKGLHRDGHILSVSDAEAHQQDILHVLCQRRHFILDAKGCGWDVCVSMAFYACSPLQSNDGPDIRWDAGWGMLNLRFQSLISIQTQ
jgi:hypothetical protein